MAQIKQPATLKQGLLSKPEGVARFENPDYIKIPSGATSDRPAAGEEGMFRYNITLGRFEGYQGGAFDSFVTQTQLDARIAAVLDSAPAALDTLNELAAALGNDSNFAATTATALGYRLRFDINNQGLTADQKTNALTNLGIQTTDGLTEGATKLFYTAARARTAISVTGTGLSYNNTTGAISSNATNANTASTIVARDASGNFTAGTITAALTGNASTATKLATARNLSLTGDATATLTGFDGSAAVSAALTLATVNNNTGTFNKVTVNGKGLVTAASNMTSTDITNTLGFIPFSYNANRQTVDINTLTAGGIYSLNSGLTNEPAGSTGNGNLVVLKSGIDGTAIISQLYSNDKGLWWRGGGSAAISGGWSKLWTDANLTNVSQLNNDANYTSGTGNSSFGGAGGSESLKVLSVAGAVNRVEVYGNSANNAPIVAAGGSDTDVALRLASKGTNGLLLSTNFNGIGTGTTQMVVNHVANAVNYLQATGAVTGSGPLLSAQGSDSNVSLYLQAKGSADIRFITGGGGQARIINTASSVNYLALTGAAAAGTPTLSVNGSDTDINLALATKGAGYISLAAGAEQARVLSVGDGTRFLNIHGGVSSNGTQPGIYSNTSLAIGASSSTIDFYTGGRQSRRQMNITDTASAVNYTSVSGAITGGSPVFGAQGTDTNVGVRVASKGAGWVQFSTGWNGSTVSTTQMVVSHTANAVNYLQATGGATANGPSLVASGADTDIDLLLLAKGAGLVRGVTPAVSDNSTAFATTAYVASRIQFGAAQGQVLTFDGTNSVWNTLSLAYMPNDWAKKSVKACSTANLTATYNAVNKTLTNSGTLAALLLDGVTGFSVNDRVLIRNQSTTSQNGIFAVLNPGSVSEPWVLQRTSDADTAAKLAGAIVVVESGSTLGGYIHACTFKTTDTLDTTAVTWNQLVNTGTTQTVGGNKTFSGTSLNFGSSTSASTISVGNSATTSGVTKIINLGTAGVSGSTTTINIGSQASGATTNVLASGTWSIGGLSIGSESLRVVPVTSAVNYLQAAGAATGNGPALSAQGADANINIILSPKGTGVVNISSGLSLGGGLVHGGDITRASPWTLGYNISNGRQFFDSNMVDVIGGNTVVTTSSTGLSVTGKIANDVANSISGDVAANIINLSDTGYGLRVAGGAAGSGYIAAFNDYAGNLKAMLDGSGNLALNAGTKLFFGATSSIYGDNAGISLYPNGQLALSVVSSSTAVNYLKVAGGATTVRPMISAQGADTDVGLWLATKGAGSLRFDTQGGSSIGLIITDSGAVNANYFQLTGAAASGSPLFSVQGTDTNIPLVLASKGGSSIIFRGQSVSQFMVTPVASAVNYLQASGAATANYPSLVAQGTDANVGLLFASKGTSTIDFRTNGTSGPRVLSLLNATSGVNYFQMVGAATAGAPTLTFTGTDADVNGVFSAKGAGQMAFWTGGGKQLQINHVASAVNYVTAIGSVTTDAPRLGVAGSDANIGLFLRSKGTGIIEFQNDAGAVGFKVAPQASSVNWIQAQGSATGSAVRFIYAGADTNISSYFVAKGSGGHIFVSNNNTSTVQFTVASATNAVNSLQVAGAAAGAYPIFQAVGSDTNVGITYLTKGLGAHVFYGGGSTVSLWLATATSAVNYFQITPATTGNGPVFAAVGADTNVSINLQPKGAGVVNVLGDFVATTITGVTKAIKEKLVTGTTAANAYAVDCSASNFVELTLSAATTTLSFTNVPTGAAFRLTLVVKQDATGSRTITWPASVNGGVAPTYDSGANKRTYITLVTYDGGVNWDLATAQASGGSGGGATGGGSDKVFVENDQNVTTDYTITAGKNASSAGPVQINTGVTVTIPTGSVWTIV